MRSNCVGPIVPDQSADISTNTIPEDEISRRVRANFDLTPRSIIGLLDLTRPIYSQTAKNGHFGHAEFGWEKTDQASKLAS